VGSRAALDVYEKTKIPPVTVIEPQSSSLQLVSVTVISGNGNDSIFCPISGYGACNLVYLKSFILGLVMKDKQINAVQVMYVTSYR
jgi:hypothetical protein